MAQTPIAPASDAWLSEFAQTVEQDSPSPRNELYPHLISLSPLECRALLARLSQVEQSQGCEVCKLNVKGNVEKATICAYHYGASVQGEADAESELEAKEAQWTAQIAQVRALRCTGGPNSASDAGYDNAIDDVLSLLSQEAHEDARVDGDRLPEGQDLPQG